MLVRWQKQSAGGALSQTMEMKKYPFWHHKGLICRAVFLFCTLPTKQRNSNSSEWPTFLFFFATSLTDTRQFIVREHWHRSLIQPKIGQVLSPISFYSRPFTAATAIFLAVALIQMERWRRRRQQQQMGLNHLSDRIGLVTVETGCETQMAAASALQTIPKRTLRTRSACTCSKVTGKNAPEESAAVVN